MVLFLQRHGGSLRGEHLAGATSQEFAQEHFFGSNFSWKSAATQLLTNKPHPSPLWLRGFCYYSILLLFSAFCFKMRLPEAFVTHPSFRSINKSAVFYVDFVLQSFESTRLPPCLSIVKCSPRCMQDGTVRKTLQQAATKPKAGWHGSAKLCCHLIHVRILLVPSHRGHRV